jgi:hypothetical protein
MWRPLDYIRKPGSGSTNKEGRFLELLSGCCNLLTNSDVQWRHGDKRRSKRWAEKTYIPYPEVPRRECYLCSVWNIIRRRASSSVNGVSGRMHSRLSDLASVRFFRSTAGKTAKCARASSGDTNELLEVPSDELRPAAGDDPRPSSRVLLLSSFQNHLDVRFLHRLPQIPMHQKTTASIQHAA